MVCCVTSSCIKKHCKDDELCHQEIKYLDKNTNMDIGSAITSTKEVKDKSRVIHFLSNDLGQHFSNKHYGNDVKSYTIGIVCVSSEFENFFKEKKPKYTKGKKTINPDGIPFTLEDSFEYSIKLDFENFKNASDIEAERILAREILKSLSVMDDFKSKIKHFDAEQFKADLKQYFDDRDLI